MRTRNSGSEFAHALSPVTTAAFTFRSRPAARSRKRSSHPMAPIRSRSTDTCADNQSTAPTPGRFGRRSAARAIVHHHRHIPDSGNLTRELSERFSEAFAAGASTTAGRCVPGRRPDQIDRQRATIDVERDRLCGQLQASVAAPENVQERSRPYLLALLRNDRGASRPNPPRAKVSVIAIVAMVRRTRRGLRGSSLDLKVDRGKMLVLALGPLRFDAQQVVTGLVNDELLADPNSSLRLEVEGEACLP